MLRGFPSLIQKKLIDTGKFQPIRLCDFTVPRSRYLVQSGLFPENIRFIHNGMHLFEADRLYRDVQSGAYAAIDVTLQTGYRRSKIEKKDTILNEISQHLRAQLYFIDLRLQNVPFSCSQRTDYVFRMRLNLAVDIAEKTRKLLCETQLGTLCLDLQQFFGDEENDERKQEEIEKLRNE